ncbi:uncharacterized protein ACLA_090580 [Aspergillus clavatus NRRL 1]|uniref:Uncharacterized protein n=1 Tax=Aspergillus clavatus (strain ATCC 1007 / CBS 513.65 / DSM 816 / NCTC 3887 / NRRL 1 / QM 1276 / 107) TaxID=344612 RepID=A1CER6_ASPCL|nr:uncharacterized protein ACLA_090580 [Aspergillus clavatus NRRL 1]EAW11365.1 hypothetical protein ACLA_090580 [Aspergillus clavatus NRRL 1]
MYAARNNFAFDAIYWNKIDQRFFGSNQPDDNVYVELKLQENETRLLSWDPDQYTLDYIAKMEA